MRNHNSQDSAFYAELLVSAYQDLASAIIPQNEIVSDANKLRKRVRYEGLSFLTKTLPALGKSIDVSLATGRVLDAAFSGFQMKVGTDLPRFGYAAFSALFRDDGVPWFATWYFDYLQWLKMPAVVDAAETAIRNNEVDEKSPWMVRFHKQITWWLSIDRKAEVNFLKGSFPGCHVLAEVGFTSQEADHIMLVGLGAAEPQCSDALLNSRREAMVVALRLLRQVCFMFYKLNLPYTDEQETRTLADFVSVDQSLDFQPERLDPFEQSVLQASRLIIGVVLCNSDPRSGIPRHGPGAVATGEKLPEKHLFKRYYERLNAAFSYDEWFFCNQSHVCDSFQELQALETLEAGTAKVVLVPKDSRGPRLISCEPLEYQWVQQSLMSVLVDSIQSNPITRGYVNFTDQTINRACALEGSLFPYGLVTLDMKEASDRVSLDLVKHLFPTDWYDCLYASRSSHTRLPDGTTVALKKFAPMGSAVCFPVEALLFWALSVAAIYIKHGMLALESAARHVRVYGDDIVVSSLYHGAVYSILSKFDLKLNENKCCVAGPFKESCGMDALFGRSVTPVKIRALWCHPSEPSGLASWVEYSNELYSRGMFESAQFLEQSIQARLKARSKLPIPTLSREGPGVIAFVRRHANPVSKSKADGCKIRYSSRQKAARNDYQQLEVQGYRVQTSTTMTRTYGWPFLLRKLTELEAKNRRLDFESADAQAMVTGQYPIAHRTRLKRAWTPLA